MNTFSTAPIQKRVRATTAVLLFSILLGGQVQATGAGLDAGTLRSAGDFATAGTLRSAGDFASAETLPSVDVTSRITEISAVPSVTVAPALEELISTPIDSRATSKQAVQVSSPPAADPFGPILSPDEGDYCAAGLDASDISEFFSNPIGSFQGADYQRAFRLADDRVLWTFQDAFISGNLVHNVGMIQSGRCFTILNQGAHSWLLGQLTSPMRQWQWIFDGGMSADGSEFHLFVVQMNETGSSYLDKSRPTALRRVVLDATTLQVIDVIEEEPTDEDLYGWGVTSDANYTYLYSHCYQQFGYDTFLGFGECSVDVKLARIPLGEFDAEREYWDGAGWGADHTSAAPVVDGSFVFSENNPAQIRFDGKQFVLVEKQDDWWGETVSFGVADSPQGPFAQVASVDEPLKCDRSACNTYFASWIPWTDSSGDFIWSIGHNRWNGAETLSNISTYRPTFATVSI